MHQDKYTVDVHHVKVAWYNKSYLKIEKMEMVKYNRTFRRVFNASFYLLKEIGTDFTYKLQVYKLLSNVYKFFPITVTFQVCQEYERNSFQVQEMMAQYTNFHICPQKPGYLYAINVRGRPNRFPPLMPSGHYKLSGKMFNQNDKLLETDLFTAIIYK